MGEATRRAGRPRDNRPKPNFPRVNATVGQVMVDADSVTKKASGLGKKMRLDDWAWCIWPEDLTSLEAIMVGALLGPFENEAAANEAAKNTWWEKRAR